MLKPPRQSSVCHPNITQYHKNYAFIDAGTNMDTPKTNNILPCMDLTMNMHKPVGAHTQLAYN